MERTQPEVFYPCLDDIVLVNSEGDVFYPQFDDAKN